MWPNPLKIKDLVTFTEDSLMENFIFCTVPINIPVAINFQLTISYQFTFNLILTKFYYNAALEMKRMQKLDNKVKKIKIRKASLAIIWTSLLLYTHQARDVFKTPFLGLFADFRLRDVNQTPLRRQTKRCH